MPVNVLLYSPGLGYINRGFETLTAEIFFALQSSPDISATLFQGTGELLDGAIPVRTLKRTAALYSAWPLRSFRYREYLSYRVEGLMFSWPVVRHALRRPCDVVYFSDPLPAEILLRLRRILGGSYRLLFCNGAPAEPKDYYHYDFVQVMTPAQQQEAVAAGFPPERLFLLPQGLRTELFAPVLGVQERLAIRDRFNLPRDKQIILSVGAIAKNHKRMDWLIQEFAQLDSSRYFLWVVGQPERESAAVMEMASTILSQDSYRFSTLPYAVMGDVYRAASLFVLCSLREGFGRVYIEAMSAGLPVIAHRNCNTEWILGQDSCGLVDMQRAGAAASAIGELSGSLRCLHNEGRRNCDRARELFDWKVLRPLYVDMLRDIAARPSGNH